VFAHVSQLRVRRSPQRFGQRSPIGDRHRLANASRARSLQTRRLVRGSFPTAQRLLNVLSRVEASVDPNSWAFSYQVRAKSTLAT
jgi:hypothetical protein